MATDNTPPRNNVILIGALATVFALVGLKYVFDSYYLVSFEGEVSQKVLEAPTRELDKMMEDEQRKLRRGKVNIDEAKMLLQSRGRGVIQDIAPVPSTDEAAKVGWNEPEPPAKP